MDFSLELFRDKGIIFPTAFSMRESLDYKKLFKLESQFSENGVSIETALKRLKKQTSIDYYQQIQTAQTDAQRFAINVFPPYKLLLPEVLMDDWLSIMGLHQKGKRDHSLHQPLTAFIVSELLGGGILGQGLVLPSGKTLLEELTRMFLDMPGTEYLRAYYVDLYPGGLPPKGYIRHSWARSIIYHTAIIAALFHDIGYPWQFLNKVGRNIDLVNRDSVGIQELVGKETSDYIKDRLLASPFYGYSNIPQLRPTSSWEKEVIKLIEDAFQKTHGFPGALAFMHLNDAVRAFIGDNNLKQAECRFIQDWASVGIMMHDMVWQYYGKNNGPDNPRYKLFIEKDPLSCIIAMADILEEFGRPMAKYSTYKRGIVTKFVYPCISTRVEVKGRTLEITYKYASKKESVRHARGRIEEVENYFRSPYGFIDLSEIGIDHVTCNVI